MPLKLPGLPPYRKRLHVGLGGRIGNRQGHQRREGNGAPTDVVEGVLAGLERAAPFARDQR